MSVGKFEVGRRVRLRGSKPDKGTITKVYDNDRVDVKFDGHIYVSNCLTEMLILFKDKSIKPKAKAERVAREWTAQFKHSAMWFLHGANIEHHERELHVIEKLPGQVVVTRESLAKAYCNGREYISLDELCKAVGLEEKRK